MIRFLFSLLVLHQSTFANAYREHSSPNSMPPSVELLCIAVGYMHIGALRYFFFFSSHPPFIHAYGFLIIFFFWGFDSITGFALTLHLYDTSAVHTSLCGGFLDAVVL